MRCFDQYMKWQLSGKQPEVPESVKHRIEQTLDALPEMEIKRKRTHYSPRVTAAAAGLSFVMLFLLPNISPAYASAVEKIPVIGDLVHVITIRNYMYSDEMHEMNIQVPELEEGNSDALAAINRDVTELTDILVQQFYEDLEKIGDKGHSSVYADYEVVTNTEKWFTLRICVVHAAGSGNISYKYYHLDKMTGEIIRLGDLASDQEFYEKVEAEIKRQMREEMKNDSSLYYWVDDAMFGEDLVSLDADHNFYWNEKGDLVIPFDKYEVAPGYMGAPEFVIDREAVADFMKKEFRDLQD